MQHSSLVLDPPSDVTDLFDLYDNTLAELLDRHAPWQQVKLRARPTAPWFDAECRVMKAKTRKLEKAYRRQRSAQAERTWRTQFSKQRTLYQHKFIDYWSCAIEACQGDSKALWSKLRSLEEPKTFNDCTAVAEDLAQYFTSKISKIRASTTTSPPPHVEDRSVLELLSDLHPVTLNVDAGILKKSSSKHC